MKKYLLLFLFPLSIFAADTIVVASQCNVYVNGINYGSMEDAIKNNSSKAAEIRTAWSSQVESDVQARLAEIAALARSGDEQLARRVNTNLCETIIARAEASGCTIRQAVKDAVTAAK